MQEIGSSNPKVKREALAVIGTLYTQVGTKLKALSMSLAKQQDAKNSLEKCFNEIEFDPLAVPTTWKKYCVVQSIGGVGAENEPPSVDLDIPKTDLLSVLPSDIISQMVSSASPFLLLPTFVVCFVSLSHFFSHSFAYL